MIAAEAVAGTSECSEVRSLSAPRMAGLETACEVLADKGGVKHVAALIGCSARALYDKRNGGTTISDFEVRLIAEELAKVAARCTRVSANLYNLIGGQPAASTSKGPNA